MTPTMLALLVLLGFSAFLNIIHLIMRPSKETLEKLSKNIEELTIKLSNSTSNLDKTISDNLGLRNQVNKLKDERKKLLQIGVGSRVLFKKDLVNKKAKQEFTVLYEADVIESSLNRLKICANTFTSEDTWPNQPANSQGVINYMQNKWVNRNECELITDTTFSRDAKLSEILDDGNS
jgi:hypothetical protein